MVDAGTAGGRRKRGERALVRVHNFAIFDRGDGDHALTAELKPLLHAKGYPRRAWVTLWDVRNVHRYTLLPAGRQNDIDAVARQYGASALGLAEVELSIAVAQGAQPNAQKKIELSFFAAAYKDIQNRLRPILDAGFLVDGVAMPCGALWALARQRRSTVPGEVHAYVSIGAARSAFVFVSNGLLLYGRELEWGYAESPVGSPTPRPSDDIAAQLAGELRRSFLYLKQYWEEDVSQVLLCGDMPEIRSLTAPMIERLGVDIETLDSLDGIDTELPEPADQFVNHVAAMRLASAVASEPPPVNLLPPVVTVIEKRVSRLGRVLFALGSAAAVALGAFLHQTAVTRTQTAEKQVTALQAEIAAVQPRLRAIELARARAGVETAQRAALEAFDAQGSRIVGILDSLSGGASHDRTLWSVHVTTDGLEWKVSARVADASGVEKATEYVVPR